MYFAFIFSERITITSSEEAVKMCEHNFFQKKKFFKNFYFVSFVYYF